MSSSSGSLDVVQASRPHSTSALIGLEYITKNIEEVRYRIENAIAERPEKIKSSGSEDVRLVAVSKMKPASHILTAYQSGHRHFGENYVQELVTKAQDLNQECPDIKWHFIGHLQSNKIAKLISVGACLDVVETVDSQRIAGVINSCREKWIDADLEERVGLPPLDVMIQVNTSGEDAKGGVAASSVNDIVGFINRECPFIRFRGLMTIGRDYESHQKPNPDFVLLAKVKDSVCRVYKLDPKRVELSMGMSSDYEEAIHMGSSNVRVGSTIFGDRDYGKQ